MVLVIAAVGTSGSGKTTTLEYLISHLSAEGYSIGAIKHIHIENFTIDKEGSNTWRYTKAGSKITVAVSPNEIAIIKKTDTSISGLDQALKSLEKEPLDIVFVEGFHSQIAKSKDLPKIVTAKDSSDLQQTLNYTVEPILAITGLVAKHPPKAVTEIPFIQIPEEGEQLLKIIKQQIESKRKPAEKSSFK
jgi:molybdopterin-guanine dinucleotide biosynthesis protein B